MTNGGMADWPFTTKLFLLKQLTSAQYVVI